MIWGILWELPWGRPLIPIVDFDVTSGNDSMDKALGGYRSGQQSNTASKPPKKPKRYGWLIFAIVAIVVVFGGFLWVQHANNKKMLHKTQKDQVLDLYNEIRFHSTFESVWDMCDSLEQMIKQYSLTKEDLGFDRDLKHLIKEYQLRGERSAASVKLNHAASNPTLPDIFMINLAEAEGHAMKAGIDLEELGTVSSTITNMMVNIRFLQRVYFNNKILTIRYGDSLLTYIPDYGFVIHNYDPNDPEMYTFAGVNYFDAPTFKVYYYTEFADAVMMFYWFGGLEEIDIKFEDYYVSFLKRRCAEGPWPSVILPASKEDIGVPAMSASIHIGGNFVVD